MLHGAYSAEHDVGGQHDPFLQVKLLRLLRVLGAGDAEASDAMSDALANVASNVNAGKNAGAAVLYEAVRCVVGVESVGGLRVLAVNVLGRFLADKDNNVRYVALNALAKVVGSAGSDAQAVQRHRRTIVECVKDGDVTIRRSALNLVYSLVNESNVQTLVPELLEYLEVADLEFKADVAKRIANLCATFAPSDRWRVDAFVTTLVKGGAHVARDECRSFLALLTNRVELQPYATRALFRAAHEARDDAHFPLIGVACWALGEYGDVAVDVARTKLAEEPPTALTARDVVDTLRSVLADARAPQDVRRVAMVALAKLAPRFSSEKKDCVDAVSAFRASLDLEMQQRSAEFDAVFRVEATSPPRRLERVPPMALRDEVGASASSAADLRESGAAGGVSDAGTADLLGDLLGDVGGGATAANAASGADLLGNLLGDVGGGGGAPLFPSGGAPLPSADPLADLMGGSPLAPGPGAAADPGGPHGRRRRRGAARRGRRRGGGPHGWFVAGPRRGGPAGLPLARGAGAGFGRFVLLRAVPPFGGGARAGRARRRRRVLLRQAERLGRDRDHDHGFVLQRERVFLASIHASRRRAQVGDARARTRVGRRRRAERRCRDAGAQRREPAGGIQAAGHATAGDLERGGGGKSGDRNRHLPERRLTFCCFFGETLSLDFHTAGSRFVGSLLSSENSSRRKKHFADFRDYFCVSRVRFLPFFIVPRKPRDEVPLAVNAPTSARPPTVRPVRETPLDRRRRRAHERVARGRARAFDAHRVRARLSSPHVARAARSRRRHRGPAHPLSPPARKRR